MSEYEQMKYEKCVREDGYADGLAESKTASESNFIHTMYENGMSIAEISKVTNKTPQEIETILSNK